MQPSRCLVAANQRPLTMYRHCRYLSKDLDDPHARKCRSCWTLDFQQSSWLATAFTGHARSEVVSTCFSERRTRANIDGWSRDPHGLAKVLAMQPAAVGRGLSYHVLRKA